MTYSERILSIHGYRDEPVPNTFFQQDAEAGHIAMLFPGIGYTCYMPLLYYQATLFLSLGADVLCVEYNYNRADFQSLPDSEQESWFQADVTTSCRAGVGQRAYSKVTLSGKSLGTRALGYLLTSEPMLRDTQAIWLTPLLKDKRLRAQIGRTTQRSLFVTGTSDKHYDAAYVEELKALPQIRTIIIEGADHSLEVKGDLSNSLRIMQRVMREIEQFLAHQGQ